MSRTATPTSTQDDVVIDLRDDVTITDEQAAEPTAPLALIAVYSIAFIGAEVFGAIDVAGGAITHAVLVLVAMWQALRGRSNWHAVSIAFVALSSTRLLTLATPLAGISIPTRAAVVGAIAIVIWALTERVLQSDTGAARFSKPVLTKMNASWAFALAVVALPAGYFVALASNPRVLTITEYGFPHTLAIAAAVMALLVGAVGEEVLFRGIASRTLHPTLASLTPMIGAALWAATYIGAQNGFVVAIAAAMGLLFGIARLRTGSLLAPIVGHTVMSVMIILVLPSLI